MGVLSKVDVPLVEQVFDRVNVVGISIEVADHDSGRIWHGLSSVEGNGEEVVCCACSVGTNVAVGVAVKADNDEGEVEVECAGGDEYAASVACGDVFWRVAFMVGGYSACFCGGPVCGG